MKADVAWGWRGARKAAARDDVTVIVDVLRFSTTAATAIAHGGVICPATEDEDADARAAELGAVRARHRTGEGGAFTLSPRDYLTLTPGTRIVLPSPNGATCCRRAASAPVVLVGAFVNARAVAEAAASFGRNVTIVACGERVTSDEDGAIRFAVEDYLGAGAILASAKLTLTVEAEVCAGAFAVSENRLDALLRGCDSGRELRDKGLNDDVAFAVQLNLFDAVPILCEERLKLLAFPAAAVL